MKNKHLQELKNVKQNAYDAPSYDPNLQTIHHIKFFACLTLITIQHTAEKCEIEFSTKKEKKAKPSTSKSMTQLNHVQQNPLNFIHFKQIGSYKTQKNTTPNTI